ncbi:hypothetical protein BCR44DRAFT_1423116 [Catenaria anguillulae PL171]|uniref:PH domain-containing protein n=1 Tax=Catenaria anguillulae PL171 TaxID=765915 RepID=A0A1Y2I3Y4_9FUNG|nr:hypothetical protein BCR44DRAFT_1423116 [Catenaria anguillulae PL171]
MMVIVYLVVTRPLLVLHWHRKRGSGADSAAGASSVAGSKKGSTARGGFQSDGSLEDGAGGSVAAGAANRSGAASGRAAGTESTPAKEEPITSLMTRIGAAYNIQNMSGIVRQWEEVNLILFHSPCASLLILPTKDSKSQGQVYVCGVQAAKMDTKLALSFPNSFLLCINTDSYVVQAKDAADAEKWVQDIEATFKPVNAISQSGEQTARQRSMTSKHSGSQAQSQSQVTKSRKASNAGNF